MKRLSPGTLILGIFAVLFGLVAAYAAKDYMQEKEVQAAAPPPETIPVPMAVADLPAGRTITQDDIMVMRLTTQQIDELKIPGPYMGKPYEIMDRTLRTPVARGQVFLINSLYPAGLGPSVAERLGSGERAVTVPFTGSVAKAGLISPGANVDVLFRTNQGGRDRIPQTTLTLLENVRVLAVGRETFEGTVGSPDAHGTVTLAVTSLQARALGVVEGRGTLTLVLRNEDDSFAAGNTAPSTLEDLLGVRSSQPFETQIYRRGRLTTVIHGDGRPKFIHESPYGMPVAAQAPNPSDQSALSTQAPASLAAHSGPWPAGATVKANHSASDQPATTEQAVVAE